MKKLTKREKLLIYTMLLLAVVASGIYFMLIPTAERILGLEETISEEESVKADYETAISLIPTITGQIDDVSKSISGYSSVFFPIMTNEEIDTMVQERMSSHSIVCMSIEFTDTAYEGIQLFGVSAPSETGASSKDSEEDYYAHIYKNQVNVKGFGSAADVKSFMADFSSASSVKMQSVETSEEDGVISFNAVLYVYMIDNG